MVIVFILHRISLNHTTICSTCKSYILCVLNVLCSGREERINALSDTTVHVQCTVWTENMTNGCETATGADGTYTNTRIHTSSKSHTSHANAAWSWMCIIRFSCKVVCLSANSDHIGWLCTVNILVWILTCHSTVVWIKVKSYSWFSIDNQRTEISFTCIINFSQLKFLK